MITDYASLKTAVADRLSRSDLTSYIPDFIDQGLQRINLELLAKGGIPDQEQIASSVTVANTESIAVPTDFGMLRWIKLAESSAVRTDPLEPQDYDEMVERYGDVSGVPEKFAYIDESFYFRPIPADAYAVRIGYLKRYPALSGSSDTNYLITKGANVLLFAALMEATSHLQDDQRISLWAQGYKEAMSLLWKAGTRARFHRPPEMQLDSELIRGRSNIYQG